MELLGLPPSKNAHFQDQGSRVRGPGVLEPSRTVLGRFRARFGAILDPFPVRDLGSGARREGRVEVQGALALGFSSEVTGYISALLGFGSKLMGFSSESRRVAQSGGL